MAEKDQPIIIKRINKGHAAAHGGAWKVAYADFVTAMMAFFMVMWLLGSDEETKAAVSHYFNNPTSAWRRDLTTKETMPLGDRTGAGDSVVNGADGRIPDDLVERPMRPVNTSDIQAKDAGEIIEQFMSDESLMSLDLLRFSVPEDLLFKVGTTDQWAKEADKFLKKLGVLTTKYKGKLIIQGSFSKKTDGDTPVGGYEFQMSRTVALSHYVVEHNWAREEQISTFVAEARRDPASEVGTARPRKIEFTLTRDK